MRRQWLTIVLGTCTLSLITVSWTGQSVAGAWQDAQKLQQSGQQAEGSAQGTNPDYEKARSQAGSGWDSRYQSPPPAVHLPSHNVGVNPQDLKKYDPKPRKLQQVEPPPPSAR
jgi:hypothetical protein